MQRRVPLPPGYVLSKGDVIVAMTEQAEGLLGSSAIVPEDRRYLHNQRLGLISVRDPQAVDLTFIYYLFNSREVRQQIRASSSGVKIRHTSPTRIGEVAVSVPPLEDQCRIADILRTYDDLIENNVRRIRILEETSRALFNEWFVNLRFPGHRTAIAVAKHLSVPQGWRIAKLAEVAWVNRAQINTKTPPERILYIDISSVGTGTIREVASLAFADAPGRARRLVQHGDILWSCVRPNRQSHVLVLSPEAGTVASTGFAVLTATKVPYTFLYHATTTDGFVAYLTNHATGAAYPAVTAKTFENADVLLPPTALLDQFAKVTVPHAELIALLQRQNVNLRRTRDLLLPRLLSGQLSSSNANGLLASSGGSGECSERGFLANS